MARRRLGGAFASTAARRPFITPLGKKGSLCDVKIDASRLKWIWKLGLLTTKKFCGANAMHIAVEINGVESVKTLLEYGATVDCLSIVSATPAHIAASMRRSQILNLLLDSGANLNLRCFGRTTESLAIAGGLVDSKSHLQAINGLSDIDQLGSSILHCAGAGNPIIFSVLLGMGCNPYSTNADGYTSIEIAIRNSVTWPTFLPLCLNLDLDFDRCIICIASLFSFIGLKDFADRRNHRILTWLFRRLPTARVIREINTIPTRGSIRETPLCQAARCGDRKMLDLLVHAGAELNLVGGPQSTPLLTACKEGRLSSVIHLVRMGAKVSSSKNGQECTAVQAAALFPEIIQWLLVARYSDQNKICWEYAESVEREIVAWHGPMTVEVQTAGLYSATHGASSLQKAKDLAELRRDLQGKVVFFKGLGAQG
jgi:ankyrin repeat protein